MSAPVIAAQDVTVRRGGRTLLAGVTLGLAPGTLTAVLGPNGAGKSTLLQVLSGGLRPGSGTVMLDDGPMHGIAGPALARRRAVLGQHQPLEFGLRCRDVVALGRLPFAGHAGAHDDPAAVAAARATFGLDPLWNRTHTTLSGGERQRVHLARVAAQLWRKPGDDAAVALLLDEPTAALDLGQQHVALGFALDRARAGAAVLAVLHDLNQAALADRVVLLRDGRVLAAGTAGEVLRPEPLRECFGVEVELLSRRGGGAAFVTVPNRT